MNFAIINTATNTIFDGPWGVLPKRVHHKGLISVSPVNVGFTEGDYKVVNVILVDNPPSQFYSWDDTYVFDFDGDVTLTLTKNYVQTSSPTDDDVNAWASDLIWNRWDYGTQLNMITEALYLFTQKGGLSVAEQTRKDEIEAAWAYIVAVLDAGAVLKGGVIPMNYTDPIHWPAVT